MPPSQHPQMNSVRASQCPLSTVVYPFISHGFQCSKVYAESLVTVFCVQKCTPVHRSQFYYPEFHTVSSVMISKPFQHTQFPVPTVEYSFTSHGLQNPVLYTALPVSYQHPQLHTVSAVSCKPFDRS